MRATAAVLDSAGGKRKHRKRALRRVQDKNQVVPENAVEPGRYLLRGPDAFIGSTLGRTRLARAADIGAGPDRVAPRASDDRSEKLIVERSRLGGTSSGRAPGSVLRKRAYRVELPKLAQPGGDLQVPELQARRFILAGWAHPQIVVRAGVEHHYPIRLVQG